MNRKLSDGIVFKYESNSKFCDPSIESLIDRDFKAAISQDHSQEFGDLSVLIPSKIQRDLGSEYPAGQHAMGSLVRVLNDLPRT